MKKLSVIIVTSTEVDKLAQCLHNLHLCNYTYRDNFEIIVIDNGSKLQDKIKEICKAVNCRYIRSEENISFSYANEIGIKASNSEWILLLNDDTIPHQSDTLRKMIKFAESKPRLAIQGVKLLFAISDNIQHCGVVFNQYRQPYHHLMNANLFDPRTMYAKQYQAVTGACLLVKRKVFEEVGGFSHIDKKWGYHYEDIDLCMKVRKAGYEVWYNPDVVIYHYSAASSSKVMTNQQECYKFLPRFQEKWYYEIEHDDYIHMMLPERNPIIMIGLPMSEGSKWIFPLLMNMIDGFHYHKKNIVLTISISNSGQTFVDEIMTYAKLNGYKYLDFLVTTDNPHYNNKMESVYANRERIRNLAIEKNVDYIFFIDTDVVMERDTLSKLVDYCERGKCDIAAGAYFYKIEETPKPMLFKSAVDIKEFFGMGENDKYEASSYMEDKCTGLGHFKIAKDWMDGKCHYAGATNMGCTLISKKCFDIPFTPENCYGTEDLAWFAKAQEKNYRLLVDTSLKLFHIDQNGYIYCFWNLPMKDNQYEYKLIPKKIRRKD
jgi:GT2 family glycosyltransferase